MDGKSGGFMHHRSCITDECLDLAPRRRVILEVSSAAAGRVCQAAKMLQAC